MPPPRSLTGGHADDRERQRQLQDGPELAASSSPTHPSPAGQPGEPPSFVRTALRTRRSDQSFRNTHPSCTVPPSPTPPPPLISHTHTLPHRHHPAAHPPFPTPTTMPATTSDAAHAMPRPRWYSQILHRLGFRHPRPPDTHKHTPTQQPLEYQGLGYWLVYGQLRTSHIACRHPRSTLHAVSVCRPSH